MHVIGLTGGIASGKSTVSQHLAELGAIILDADKVAREIVAPGKPALEELIREFGEEILLTDDTLDRAKLGQIVFNDPTQREKLNKITHPKIVAELRTMLAELSGKNENHDKVVVVDAALLVEVGLLPLVEEVWLVVVDRETQLKRLMARDNFSREDAEARLSSQMSMEQRLAYATHLIQNDGTLESTIIQVDELWRNLLSGK